jgi:hypothetical protein
VPQQIRHDQFDIRVDYALKSNNNLYARVSYKRSEPKVLDSGLPAELTGLRVQVRMARQVAISDTWTISPTVINEFKAGFARNFNPREGTLFGQTLVDELGIQGLQPAPGVENVPSLTMTGFQAMSQIANAAPAENTFPVRRSAHAHSRQAYDQGRYRVQAAAVQRLRASSVRHLQLHGLCQRKRLGRFSAGHPADHFAQLCPASPLRPVLLPHRFYSRRLQA